MNPTSAYHFGRILGIFMLIWFGTKALGWFIEDYAPCLSPRRSPFSSI